MPTHRWLLLLIIAALATGGTGCTRSNGRTEYVTARVERGRITAVVNATGTVNPVTTVQVGTYVSGPIQKLYADFNSPVTKGQLVAEIDPQQFLLRVKQAEANLANARARVDHSRADLDLKRLTLQRTRNLFTKTLAPQSDLDAAETASRQAEAQLQLDQAGVLQAEAALEEAKVNLSYTRIVSPVDGVVIRRDVDVGQTVAASFQTPTLFLIAGDVTKMQVNTNVSESDIGNMREGQTASFSVDAYPDRFFAGTVTQVRNAPLTVQNVVTYDVVIGVDNHDLALKPGMTANVSIITAMRDNILTVPAAALRFRPPTEPTPAAGSRPAPAVWRRSSGSALEPVPVTVGVADDRNTEVTAAELREGDEIVVAIKGKPAGPEAQQVIGMPRFR